MTAIVKNPPKAFVIGWPIKHSRSPLIHAHWLREMNVAGSYRAVSVEPGKVQEFLSTVGKDASAYVGGNVTIPHKEAAFQACVQTSEIAGCLRAVNTVWVENGVLCGDNTDGHGFTANMDDQAPGWDKSGRPAVILGSGGSARAILLALQNRGLAPLRIVNRTPSRARQMIEDLDIQAAIFTPDQMPEAMDGAGLFVNTTSLGMTGQPPLDIDVALFGPDMIVSDIVYVPLETGLLRAAHAKGLNTVDGLGMLLHQAVPGFARWFGQSPVVTSALRDILVADLGANAC
jgi:shikimate dehydrogenase